MCKNKTQSKNLHYRKCYHCTRAATSSASVARNKPEKRENIFLYLYCVAFRTQIVKQDKTNSTNANPLPLPDPPNLHGSSPFIEETKRTESSYPSDDTQ